MYWFAYFALLLWTATCDILSIDIGNQYFKVALVSTGKFEIVHNLQSKRKTPTAISFKSAIRNFGDDALIDSAKTPSKVASFFRWLVGANSSAVNAKDLYLSEFASSFEVSSDLERHSVIFGNDDYTRRSIEETVAHIIWYAKNLVEEHDTVSSGRHKIGSLKDLVLAVPSWATQRERQAVLDAATIAGFAPERVSLVHETSAAAVQRGFDLDLSQNGTREVTTMFLNMGSTHFESCIVHYGLHGNKTATPTAQVMGCAHSFKAGGSEVTKELAREAISAISTKYPKKNLDEIARVRIFRQAESVKHTLSANKDALFSIESLFEDIDFRKSFLRSDVEKMAAPVLSELEATISSVLAKTGLTKDQIHQVEVIGGGWRVPIVQAKLESLVDPLPLGQHLNGDESVVFGAAFIAANSSSNFRVRKILFTDITDNEYSLTVNKEGAINEQQQQHVDEKWPRTQTVFKLGHKLNSVKAIKLTVNSDLRVDLAENGAVIESYSITGRNESATVDPQIVIKLKLDSNGIVAVLGADAVYEKVLIVEPDSNVTAPTRKDKVSLKVESIFRAFPLPMSDADLKASREALKEIVDQENRINLIKKVRNDLESLIYSIRDKMGDDSEIRDNSSQEERDAAIQASHEAETWFDDNAWSATVDDLKAQIDTLKLSTKPIYDRIQEKRREAEAKLKAIADAKKAEEDRIKMEEQAAKILEDLAKLQALNETVVPTPEEEFHDVVEEATTVIPEEEPVGAVDEL